jgi:uncharacterized protein (DUF433 family)
MAIVRQEYVEIDEQGVARVAGFPYKVIEIAADWNAIGDTPEDIAFRFAGLSPAQVLGALAYYYDHKAELDAQLADDATAESAAELTVRAIAVNRLTWLKMARDLRRDYPGKFAAFHQGRLLGVVDTLLQALALVNNLDPPFEQALAFPIDEGPGSDVLYSFATELVD